MYKEFNNLLNNFEYNDRGESFDSVKIGLASPIKIRNWSFGEVKNSETINYRTFKPERDGLFCSKIFGPVKDYECVCGKYKGIKYKGVTCEKCRVEIVKSKVRRDRMGHIELATYVSHIWFLRSLPSKLSVALNMNLSDLERVLYFEAYVVISSKTGNLKVGQVLDEDEYLDCIKYNNGKFKVNMGAEAILYLLQNMDVRKEVDILKEKINLSSGVAAKKYICRLELLDVFCDSKFKLDWMILKTLPVLPPDLRPLVSLDGGRFAASDLNELYRRVINRNNRLKRLMALNSPEIVLRNEKRMLQESVDALFDNGRRGKFITGSNKRPLKSLSDVIKGKTGRFRQNLLGKRVDYSGRSVIVVGPNLKLNQCGLPKIMAIELFKPFVLNRLESLGICDTVKAARIEFDNKTDIVWEVLEDVVNEHPVVLNRAPTLHRLGVQAFEPVLVDGKAIQLHPLVCSAFNADFDGDQMAIHIPLSVESQIEAKVLMLSSNNILFPASGDPSITPSQDIILGLYYATIDVDYSKGDDMIFCDSFEVFCAFENNIVGLNARIFVRISGKLYITTVGRALLSRILPNKLSFSHLNKPLKKKEISNLILESFYTCGLEKTIIFVDKLMQFGIYFSTLSGLSISINDMSIPPIKSKLVVKSLKNIQKYKRQYKSGFCTIHEYHNNTVNIWEVISDKVCESMMEQLFKESIIKRNGLNLYKKDFNPIYVMAESGARGSIAQIYQLSGMRGLMTKPNGSVTDTPIIANFREGLNILQYFISTHGARKGLSDTALKTANSGYLTRRLVDVTQDVIITEVDCGTIKGIDVKEITCEGETISTLSERILGRVIACDIFYQNSSKILYSSGTLLNEKKVKKIKELNIDSVKVRTVLMCESKNGLCSLCYGRDLGRGNLINVGEAVGIIAAQSIGEPGTQLTMRTFHVGGAVSSIHSASSVVSKSSGIMKIDYKTRVVIDSSDNRIVVSNFGEIFILDDCGNEIERYKIPHGSLLFKEHDEYVESNMFLCKWDPVSRYIISGYTGVIKFENIIEDFNVIKRLDEETGFITYLVTHNKGVLSEDDKNINPLIMILPNDIDENESLDVTCLDCFVFQPGTVIIVDDGQIIKEGDILARIPILSQKKPDITGGLPRVAELFEARIPKSASLLSDEDGIVSILHDVKNKQHVVVKDRNKRNIDYYISRSKQILVHDNQIIKRGDMITNGLISPHDILRLKGVKELLYYVSNEIQDVYRGQGVKINDKHIEVIIRQMLRHVRIIHSGGTDYAKGQIVSKTEVFDANNIMRLKGERVAVYEDVFMGITKSSLSTESFISAASFQETTRILTDASVMNKEDKLYGLKENVVIGRLIPAGTGSILYRCIDSVKKQIFYDKNNEIFLVY